MAVSAAPPDCVAFMLIAGNRLLVEKRSQSKRLLPGALAIPGGHVEAGESIEEALVREVREELNIAPRASFHLCTLLHYDPTETRRIHYFVVEQWTGEIQLSEAESLRWIPLFDLSALDVAIDVEAVEHYLTRRRERPIEVCAAPAIRAIVGGSAVLWGGIALLALNSYFVLGNDGLWVGLCFLLACALCILWLRTIPRGVRFERDQLVVGDWWWKSALRWDEIVTVRVTHWGLLIGTMRQKVHLSNASMMLCTVVYEEMLLRLPFAKAAYEQRFARLPFVLHSRRFAFFTLFGFSLLTLVALPIPFLHYAFTTTEMSVGDRWGSGVFGVIWLAMGVWLCTLLLAKFVWRYTFTPTQIEARYVWGKRTWPAAAIHAIQLMQKEQYYSGMTVFSWQVLIKFANAETLPVQLGMDVAGDTSVGDEALLYQLAARLKMLYLRD